MLIYLHSVSPHEMCEYRTLSIIRSSSPKVFIGKGVLKICSRFTGEHPCWSVISIKLQSNIIQITLRHGCSPVNLQPFFRIPFYKNTSGGVLLNHVWCSFLRKWVNFKSCLLQKKFHHNLLCIMCSFRFTGLTRCRLRSYWCVHVYTYCHPKNQ